MALQKTFGVTALGDATLEFNQTTPGEPPYLQGFGGDTSNAAIAAARAGARSAYGGQTVVLKLGADGALVSDGQQREHVNGQRVTVVDATGAGDCFCGNLLARMAIGDDVFLASHYTKVAAALAVQGYGAVGPPPFADQVLRTKKKTPSTPPWTTPRTALSMTPIHHDPH